MGGWNNMRCWVLALDMSFLLSELTELYPVPPVQSSTIIIARQALGDIICRHN